MKSISSVGPGCYLRYSVHTSTCGRELIVCKLHKIDRDDPQLPGLTRWRTHATVCYSKDFEKIRTIFPNHVVMISNADGLFPATSNQVFMYTLGIIGYTYDNLEKRS
jgi:hypothetical protein